MSAVLHRHEVTAERRAEILKEFGEQLRTLTARQRALAAAARLALAELVKVCRRGTDQSYKVRGFLFSLWNGKAASLLDLLELDLAVRLKLLDVCAGFGWRGDAKEPEFFYDAVKAAFSDAGLWAWFQEEANAGGEA